MQQFNIECSQLWFVCVQDLGGLVAFSEALYQKLLFSVTQDVDVKECQFQVFLLPAQLVIIWKSLENQNIFQSPPAWLNFNFMNKSSKIEEIAGLRAKSSKKATPPFTRF